jgi:hypothetical protein
MCNNATSPKKKHMGYYVLLVSKHEEIIAFTMERARNMGSKLWFTPSGMWDLITRWCSWNYSKS